MVWEYCMLGLPSCTGIVICLTEACRSTNALRAAGVGLCLGSALAFRCKRMLQPAAVQHTHKHRDKMNNTAQQSCTGAVHAVQDNIA